MTQLQEHIDMGSAAVQKAAHALRSSKSHLEETVATEESGREVKIVADGLLNKIITDELRPSGIEILSEESGELKGAKENERVWIVDPLDGSVNFSRGIALCGISVALCQGGSPIAGILYDINTQELLIGSKEQGASANGKILSTAKTSELSKAILCTGFPARSSFHDKDLHDSIQQIQRFHKIRMFGSAVQSLIHLAKGQTDAYIERDIMIWDVAAGLAIVEAAGGKWHWEESAKNTVDTSTQAAQTYFRN